MNAQLNHENLIRVTLRSSGKPFLHVTQSNAIHMDANSGPKIRQQARAYNKEAKKIPEWTERISVIKQLSQTDLFSNRAMSKNHKPKF